LLAAAISSGLCQPAVKVGLCALVALRRYRDDGAKIVSAELNYKQAASASRFSERRLRRSARSLARASRVLLP
jgi:hypothetical protein